jgi:hypothetical protein
VAGREDAKECFDLARLRDLVAPPALLRQREAERRVDGELLALEGAAVDRSQGKDGVCDRARGEAGSEESVD